MLLGYRLGLHYMHHCEPMHSTQAFDSFVHELPTAAADPLARDAAHCQNHRANAGSSHPPARITHSTLVNHMVLSPAATSVMGHAAATHNRHRRKATSLHRCIALTCSTLPFQAKRAAQARLYCKRHTHVPMPPRASSKHGSPSHHRRPLHRAGSALCQPDQAGTGPAPSPDQAGTGSLFGTPTASSRPAWPCASQIRLAQIL